MKIEISMSIIHCTIVIFSDENSNIIYRLIKCVLLVQVVEREISQINARACTDFHVSSEQALQGQAH